MQYFIGGLVGVVVALVYLSIMGKVIPPNPTEVDEALMKHWRRWDTNEEERNIDMKRIADAVTTWEQRYTRKKVKREEG
jgi:hypothetical protein